MVQSASLHVTQCIRVGVWQFSPTFQKCLWGHALKKSPGINRKSRVLYPDPGFLSSATWHSLPKKHYNGLINQSIIFRLSCFLGAGTIGKIKSPCIFGFGYVEPVKKIKINSILCLVAILN